MESNKRHLRVNHVLRWIALCLPLGACSASVVPERVAAPSSATQADISSEAAKQEFAVERALGADCPTPGKDNDDYFPNAWLPNGICKGEMPTHVARAVVSLPVEALQLTPADRRELTVSKMPLRAVPGLGSRADLFVDLGKGWLRSFEGTDPAATVYLLQDAFGELHAYRTRRDGTISDVTAEILPPQPVLSEAEREFYYAESRGPSDPLLLESKLYYVPTMRWVMEFDSHDSLPTNTPNRLNGNMVHLGFLRWTGTRFELRRTVPRAQWPCYPVLQGKAPCSQEDADPDPYLTDDR